MTFQVHYNQGGGYVGPKHGLVDPGPSGFEVAVLADLDRDGDPSVFTHVGYVGSNGELLVQPFYSCANPEE